MKFDNDSDREDAMLEINITSLVDVVFILLIFFMVSTSFVSTTGIKVNLPKASSGQVKAEPQEIVVTVTKAGQLFVGAKQVSDQTVERELISLAEGAAPATVIVRADEAVSHGKVVSVMESVKRAGIDKIAISTEHSPAKPK